MAKRKINFSGPSVKDLGIKDEENGIAVKGNAELANTINGNTEMNIANTNIGNSDKGIAEPIKTELPTGNRDGDVKGSANIGDADKGITEKGIVVDGITNNSVTNNSNTKKTYNKVQFKLVRDYLYAALGDNERVEIKLSVMGQELGINPKTLYKHLKTLRETEFILTKLQYCTEIRRR